jgi:poly-gamma-glutamate capsule biosynthesis protein CapA/YwtB (metallophosphatase superfamily)
MRLFLCGDVMTGRGIDQALPHPASPVLDEPCIRDARVYVDLAQKANGPIPRPASFGYIWGAALQELERVDLRIINLETGITPNGTPWPGKTRAGLSSDFFVIRHSSRCPRLATASPSDGRLG